MFRNTVFIITATLALISFSHAGQGPDIHEGEWKITVDFNMAGVPINMPPITYNQCITKKNPIPKSEKPNQVCKNENVTTKGNTVTWTTTCNNPGGEMSGTGSVTFKKDKMNGTMTMKDEGGMTMKSQYMGHRIGDCK